VLAVDKTGCGSPVVDALWEKQPQALLRPVLITAGFETTVVDGCWHVPKRELVGSVRMVLDDRRIEVPETIPEQKVLERELVAFRAKVTAKGNETFEADWRQAPHDDMVLGTAMALFFGEREPYWEDLVPPTQPPENRPRGAEALWGRPSRAAEGRFLGRGGGWHGYAGHGGILVWR
jgi:hypothetical protein